MVQFLAIGGVLSALWWGLWAPPANDPNRIEVTQAAIEQFMQFRTRNFSDAAAERFEQMTPAARRAVVEEFVREEALYREAMRLGLAEGDYVIRQRLVQKVDFMGARGVEHSPTRAELETLLSEREASLRVPAMVTFTHIFLRVEEEPNLGSENERALALRQELNRKQVPFHQATRFGDRFAYWVNYVEQPLDVVAGHFGQDAAQAIFELPIESGWQGPIGSSWGLHLINKQAHIKERAPSVEDIEPQLTALWRAERESAVRREAAERILSQYDVVIAPPIRSAIEP